MAQAHSLSDFREKVLIRLFKALADDPSQSISLDDLSATNGVWWKPSWPKIVLQELRSSNLIQSTDEVLNTSSQISLTVNGFYESEKLAKKAKRRLLTVNGIGAAAGVLSVVVAIAYPEYQSRRQEWKDAEEKCLRELYRRACDQVGLTDEEADAVRHQGDLPPDESALLEKRLEALTHKTGTCATKSNYDLNKVACQNLEREIKEVQERISAIQN